MFEKVNPCHPDKIADRIAGALVDFAYSQTEDPKIAVEVLIGHNECNIICETNVFITTEVAEKIVTRIAGEGIKTNLKVFSQDAHLADNLSEEIKCGDNGIFKGAVTSSEEMRLSLFAREMFKEFPSDGKFVYDGKTNRLIVCLSNTNGKEKVIGQIAAKYFVRPVLVINPLGDWTGGINVDTGATNRKIGSDLGRGATGGGLHGKDLSKADVAVNIYAYKKAEETNENVEMFCAIGDVCINDVPYKDIVERAKDYIMNAKGGFEKFAEWGIV